MPNDTAAARQGIFRIDPDRLALVPLELDPMDFQSPLPVQNYYLIYEDPAIGLAVGIWDTTTMQEAFGPYPGDEFITVLEGSFAILDGMGGAVTGSPGQSATFRNGIPVSWKQEGYLRKIYLTLIPPDLDPPQIASAAGGVKILPEDPSRPRRGEETLLQNDRGTMTVRLRAYAETTIPAAPTQMHELCRILTGEMILTDAAGQAHRFGPGDHAFVPAGTIVARDMRADTAAYHVTVTA